LLLRRRKAEPMAQSSPVQFTNREGHQLAGVLEWPLDSKPGHFALFAHCFTCGKDFKAERNIARALSQNGFAVLRFDFTGLGQSEGAFADANFSSNVSDLLAAAEYLEEHYRSPELLVGHSLGGTAVLMAAGKLPSVRAVASIAAPCDPAHVLQLLSENSLEEIKAQGEAEVSLAGRTFKIKEQFIEDLKSNGIEKVLENMRDKALLVLHSPQDSTVEVENARHIYSAAWHPKSFISLDGADHLLSRPADSHYAGNMIAAWSRRYLSEDSAERLATDSQLVARLSGAPYRTELMAGKHRFKADEPKKVGGQDTGPNPYELLQGALASCTAITLRMYADRKEWPLQEVKVHLDFDKNYTRERENCEDSEPMRGKFTRRLELEGPLDEKQKQRLLQIANKCPVHRTLEQGVTIETLLIDG